MTSTSQDISGEDIWSVSALAGAISQTLDFAYGRVLVEGEVSNFKISRNTWVYFDLKDDDSSLRCFGSIYSLSTPLEDGMRVVVEAAPKLHNQYGFSLNIFTAQPVGEGSIKKAADITKAKLEAEGLFDESRKRILPSLPQKIGLITSLESAAFQDFTKILSARWSGIEIIIYDCLVQGLEAPSQITKAINYFDNFNVDVLVITRGGGSADDLAAFNTELVVRAVAGSRTPVMVAVGHENDFTLAELAADVRASTPSNAAEIVVPDKSSFIEIRRQQINHTMDSVRSFIDSTRKDLTTHKKRLSLAIANYMSDVNTSLTLRAGVLSSLNPELVLKRGYAIIREQNKTVYSVKNLEVGQAIEAQLKDGKVQAQIKAISVK